MPNMSIYLAVSVCVCVGVGAVFAAAQPTHFSLFGEKLCTSCHSRKRFASFRPRRKRHAHSHTHTQTYTQKQRWQLACLPLYCGRHEVAKEAWTLTHTHTHIPLQIVSCQINKDSGGQAKFGFFSCLAVCVCVYPGYVCARTRLVIISPVADSCHIREWGGGRSNNNRIHLYPSFALQAPCCSFGSSFLFFLLFCQFYLIGFASGHSRRQQVENRSLVVGHGFSQLTLLSPFVPGADVWVT